MGVAVDLGDGAWLCDGQQGVVGCMGSRSMRSCELEGDGQGFARRRVDEVSSLGLETAKRTGAGRGTSG